ncbi:ABC transporter ATP-binding protein [Microbacterium sp. A93]|uniref:ABC transporter ATP-binding protein n=1 Tax=unclassified Microbacterium TaxID=2609290 RepID=UPI003F438BB7
MTLLEVSGLTITTPAGLALVNDVSFRLERGEALGIVGESGSGKSLSCRAVLGIVPEPLNVTADRIDFDGTDLRAATATQWQRIRGTRIGAVFQDPGSFLNPSISVGRQLAEVHRVKNGRRRREAWASAIRGLGDLGLVAPERVVRRFPYEMSGGMLQRVLLAIAIAESPDLLIADEPTTALDVTVQAEVLDVIADLRATTGLAVLFVSHDLPVVAHLCDRIQVMQHGRTVESGASADVLQAPAHPYTRALLTAHAEYGLDRFLRPEVAHV